MSLSEAMIIRSKLKSFHPSSEMKCLTKDRQDIVAIKRSEGQESIFAIHNITENKLNFSINDNQFKNYLKEEIVFKDYLTGKKYSNLNFVLDPFQVLWIGI